MQFHADREERIKNSENFVDFICTRPYVKYIIEDWDCLCMGLVEAEDYVVKLAEY